MTAHSIARNPTQHSLFPLALLIATALHALMIMGTSFNFTLPEDLPTPSHTMEIILVHHRSASPPERADYLAQSSSSGGGNKLDQVRPQNPASSPKVVPEQGLSTETAPVRTPKPTPPQQSVVTRNTADKPSPAPQEPSPPVAPTPRPSAAELIQRSREIARLSTEISQAQEAYSQLPRHKSISARTQEYRYAAYMDAWRRKVERIGNLNYPDEAKRRKLTGSLLLDVALNPDGSVHTIKLLRSSGNVVLDDAAARIVKLAAPFAPFPDNIREETDILHITRTWQFRSDNRLSSR